MFLDIDGLWIMDYDLDIDELCDRAKKCNFSSCVF